MRAHTLNLMLHHIGCASFAHTLTCLFFFSIIQYQANGKQTDYMFFSNETHASYTLFIFFNLPRMKLIIVLFFMTKKLRYSFTFVTKPHIFLLSLFSLFLYTFFVSSQATIQMESGPMVKMRK